MSTIKNQRCFTEATASARLILATGLILVIKKRHQRGKSQAKGKHDSIINKKKLFQYYSCANYAKSAFEVICLADASRAIFPNFKLHFVKCILNFTRDMQLSKQFQFRSGRSVGQQNCREWLDIITGHNCFSLCSNNRS